VGAAVTAIEDCSTDERMQQETLCRRQWTDECVERTCWTRKCWEIFYDPKHVN